MFYPTKSLTVAATALLLSACNFQSGTDATGDTFPLSMDTGTVVAIAAASPDYSSSDVLTISSNTFGVGRLRQGELTTTNPNDIGVSGGKGGLYRLNRGLDSITHYSADNFGALSSVWEYGVADNDDEGNPYALIEKNNDTGYVLRYDSPLVSEVDLGAGSGQNFVTSTVDLSSHSVAGTDSPHMADGAIIDNVLYIVMQRLTPEDQGTYTSLLPKDNSYITAIDLTTNSERSWSGRSTSGLDLEVKNANDVSVFNEMIYVAASGTNGATTDGQYEGGIVRVPQIEDSAPAELLLDDGSGEYTWGRMTSIAVADANNAYFVGSSGWGDDTLYHFNPSAADVANSVTSVTDGGAGIGDIQIVRNSDTGNPSTLLFIGQTATTDSSARVMVIEVSTSPKEIAESVDTKFNPTDIAVVY